MGMYMKICMCHVHAYLILIYPNNNDNNAYTKEGRENSNIQF